MSKSNLYFVKIKRFFELYFEIERRRANRHYTLCMWYRIVIERFLIVEEIRNPPYSLWEVGGFICVRHTHTDLYSYNRLVLCGIVIKICILFIYVDD